MPGYASSMGAISFCGRTTVSRDTNSDNSEEIFKPLWDILFSDGTIAQLRGDTIQEVINITDMERIISIKRKE